MQQDPSHLPNMLDISMKSSYNSQIGVLKWIGKSWTKSCILCRPGPSSLGVVPEYFTPHFLTLNRAYPLELITILSVSKDWINPFPFSRSLMRCANSVALRSFHEVWGFVVRGINSPCLIAVCARQHFFSTAAAFESKKAVHK